MARKIPAKRCPRFANANDQRCFDPETGAQCILRRNHKGYCRFRLIGGASVCYDPGSIFWRDEQDIQTGK
jgi:hypothetical protein